MTAPFSVDTDILVYAADPGVGEKAEIARTFLLSAALAEASLTQQVIGEFLNVGRRLAGMDQLRLRRIATNFARTFRLLATPPDLLFDAFDRATRNKLQFWDSVIITVCLANGIDALVSEDMQDGQNIDGLIILNPFETRNADRLRTLLSA